MATTWSYIGAKTGQLGVGLSLNHTTGVGFTVDTGLSLDLLSALTLSVALRSVELGSDGLVARDGTVSGVEWRISEGLSLGLGVANLSSPIYRLSVDAGGKAITARCYAIGERNAQMDSGIEVGLKLRGVTLKLGYHLDGQQQTNRRTGPRVLLLTGMALGAGPQQRRNLADSIEKINDKVLMARLPAGLGMWRIFVT